MLNLEEKFHSIAPEKVEIVLYIIGPVFLNILPYKHSTLRVYS